tara:strand:- start:2011 stop:2577 length:567 start_codon:yes stop_codon:yes gene_type:complete
MMDQILFYLKIGFSHIMDINAYDHLLFLASISIIYSFRTWKKLFWIVTFFTIGHSMSLVISSYGIYKPNTEIIEFLIPITIIISALSNLFFIDTSKKINYFTVLIALFFGLIHGFGFANFFSQISFSDGVDLVALIGFSLGVEVSQILIAISILVLNSILFWNSNKHKKNYIRIISFLVCLLTILIFI